MVKLREQCSLDWIVHGKKVDWSENIGNIINNFYNTRYLEKKSKDEEMKEAEEDK